MTTKSIKISEENYRLLVEKSAALAKKKGRPVSINRALTSCLSSSSKKNSLLGLATLKDDAEFIDALENAYRESRADPGRTW